MYSTMYADEALMEGALMDSAAMTTGIMGFFAGYFAILAIIAVIGIIANWKLFSKAGKPGWASIIPVYNTIVQFQIVGINPWLLLLLLVPFANIVFAIVIAIMVPFRMAKSYGKGAGFGWGMFLLPFIFNLILAFGSSEYVGPNGEKQA